MNREQMIAWLTLEGWTAYKGTFALGVYSVAKDKQVWVYEGPNEGCLKGDVSVSSGRSDVGWRLFSVEYIKQLCDFIQEHNL